MRTKSVIRIAVATAFILLIPLIAMQFTREVNWTPSDFIVMGALLFGTGLVFDLAMRKARNITHRVAFGLLIVAAFLYIWAELAVGIFTNWGS
jgi:hypothetical protein